MTNKEAIEELRELIEIDLHPCPLIYEEALNLAIKVLERQHGVWIPVSEKLPDIAKKCIVQLTDGHITIGSYHSIDKWTFQETKVIYAYPKESVIAWQPLPEAYKKEEEKNE